MEWADYDRCCICDKDLKAILAEPGSTFLTRGNPFVVHAILMHEWWYDEPDCPLCGMEAAEGGAKNDSIHIVTNHTCDEFTAALVLHTLGRVGLHDQD